MGSGVTCTSTRETSATGMRYIDSSLVPGRAHIKVLLQMYTLYVSRAARARAFDARVTPIPAPARQL
eukprot:scaffold19984_cov65-Phaeocystis_antarctica.AAC.2